MFKKSMIALVAVVAVQVADAQVQQGMVDSVVTVETKNADKYRVETNRFGSNWFVGFGVGGQMYFGDHDKQMKFFDRISPAFEVYFGKWFTPGIGVRFGVSGYEFKGVSGWTGHSLQHPNVGYNNYQGYIIEPRKDNVYGLEESGAYPLYKTNQKYLQARADVMFNVTQMVMGYKQDRFYSFIPYLGLGWMQSLERASVSGVRSAEVGATFGIANRFRLSNALDLNVDIRGTYVNDRFDQESVVYKPSVKNYITEAGRSGEGLLMATVGLSYNFNKRHWDRSTNTTIRVNENVLNDLRGRIGQLQSSNDDLRRQLENALNREITQETVAAQPLLVTFPIDRWTLSNKDRVNLGFLATVIKANPKMIYTITGYADKGTGSVKRNIFLARKRSEVIYDCLVKEFGVSESQLRKDSKGGVANMYYNDPRCSRAVLLKVAE